MSTVKEFFVKLALGEEQNMRPVTGVPAMVANRAPRDFNNLVRGAYGTAKPAQAIPAQHNWSAPSPTAWGANTRANMGPTPVTDPGAPAPSNMSSPAASMSPNTSRRLIGAPPMRADPVLAGGNASLQQTVFGTSRAPLAPAPTFVSNVPGAAAQEVRGPGALAAYAKATTGAQRASAAAPAAPVAAPSAAPAAAPTRQGPSRAILAQRQRTAQEIGNVDAIKAFQAANGIQSATGAVGPRTMAAWAARNQSPDQKLALPARPTLAARPLELAPLGQAPVAPMAQRAAAAPAPQGSPLFPAPGGAPQGAAAVAPAAYAQTPPSPAAPLGAQVASRMLINPRRQAMAM